MSCPPVSIRAGASTYAVGTAGKQPVGNDLRFQASITRTARQCTRNGDQITARIGIQGRVIAGPADIIAETRIWRHRAGGRMLRSYPYLLSAMKALDYNLGRMAALPGWKSAYDLLPGKRLTHYAK